MPLASTWTVRLLATKKSPARAPGRGGYRSGAILARRARAR
jgi:hypothetical protein